MLHHLKPKGSMGLLLANGSMSSNAGGEGDIRKNLIEADLVECIVALPGQLFTNTQIPACIWFLTRSKKKQGDYRDRAKEFLFIDARNKGHMASRILKEFSSKETHEIASTFHNWKKGEGYEDIAGFSKSVTFDEVKSHDFILTPGRYVGAADVENDGLPFDEKMQILTTELNSLFEDSVSLEKKIRENLAGIGYDI